MTPHQRMLWKYVQVFLCVDMSIPTYRIKWVIEAWLKIYHFFYMLRLEVSMSEWKWATWFNVVWKVPILFVGTSGCDTHTISWNCLSFIPADCYNSSLFCVVIYSWNDLHVHTHTEQCYYASVWLEEQYTVVVVTDYWILVYGRLGPAFRSY